MSAALGARRIAESVNRGEVARDHHVGRALERARADDASDRPLHAFLALGGDVADERPAAQGGALAGATVLVTNMGTNVAVRARTNAEGAYLVTNLVPGRYRVNAEASGFDTRAEAVILEVGQRARLDFTLKVGTITEAVEVTEVRRLLSTDQAQLGSVIDQNSVAKLPLAIRNWDDLLALVGDTADGFPGLPGWGAKSAAAVLRRWGHLEKIPGDPVTWDSGVRGAAKLNATLREQFELALLFRRIATIETDAPVSATVDELRWTGPPDPAAFDAWCRQLGAPALVARTEKLAESRA